MKGRTMSWEEKCLRCGDTNLHPCSIQSTGKVSLRAENVRFFTLKTDDISIKAHICLNCGHIEFVGDMVKAKALVKTS